MSQKLGEAAIQKGAAYLVACQAKNGSFASYSTSNKTTFKTATQRHTTFFASLILRAVSDITHPDLDPTKKRIATFLMEQKSVNWSFNYWSRDSREFTAQPYPDDLDDTFVALAALCKNDPAAFTGSALAHITRLLIASEQAEGGPYCTWLVDDTAGTKWRDVDIAVNANVGYFLSLQGIALPNIVALIEASIQKGALSSPYYPDFYPIAYFVGNWYQGELKDRLVKFIEEARRGAGWGNPLQTALAVTTLLCLGYESGELQTAVGYLLRTQNKDGGWPAAAFCYDPAQAGKATFAGASCLTTAFCLEALHRYAQAAQQAPRQSTQTFDRDYATVEKAVRASISTLRHAELRDHTLGVLGHILKHDSDKQIILLPRLVRSAARLELSNDILHSLAQASVWGWMAYTIYDDFLDGEGDPQLLPSANLSLRNLLACLRRTLPQNTDFQHEAMAIMDRLDAANAWEIAYCRGVVKGSRLHLTQLPNYGSYWQLAERSLGHTISGLGVLYGAGFGKSAPELQALRDFFWHYLIARQLNDDAHDWQEDLKYGHVNAVGALILAKWTASGGSLQKGIPLYNMSRLQTILWEKVIDEVCQLIYDHTNRAWQAVANEKNKFEAGPFEALLAPLRAAADEALQKRGMTQEFIAAL